MSPLLLFAQSPGLFYPRTSAPLCSLLLSFASLSPSPSSAHSCTAPSRLTSPPFTPVRRCSGAGRRSRARCAAQLWMRAGGALSSSPPPLGSRWKVRQGEALQIPCRPLRLQSTAEPAKGCCGKMLSLPSSIAKPRGVCVCGGQERARQLLGVVFARPHLIHKLPRANWLCGFSTLRPPLCGTGCFLGTAIPSSAREVSRELRSWAIGKQPGWEQVSKPTAAGVGVVRDCWSPRSAVRMGTCSPPKSFSARGAVHALHSGTLKKRREKGKKIIIIIIKKAFPVRFPAPSRGGKAREQNKHEKHCGTAWLALPQLRSLCQLLSPGTARRPPIGLLWALGWIWRHFWPRCLLCASATHLVQLSVPS